VVLAFVNVIPDTDTEYFSDGLTDGFITDLPRVKAVRVISRTTVMRYTDSTLSLREIGTAVGVRGALTGSARRAGSALRISAQLVDVRRDQPEWAEKYSGTLDDVFDVAVEIAGRVPVLRVARVPGLRDRRSGHRGACAAARPGARSLGRRHPVFSHYFPAGRGKPDTRGALQWLADDPLSPLANIAVGANSWWTGQFTEGTTYLEQAVRLVPAGLIFRWGLGNHYTLVGRYEEAARQAGWLTEHAPHFAYTRTLHGLLLGAAGRHAEAQTVLDAIDMVPLDGHHIYDTAELLRLLRAVITVFRIVARS